MLQLIAHYKLNGEDKVYYFYDYKKRDLSKMEEIEGFMKLLPTTEGVTDFKIAYTK